MDILRKERKLNHLQAQLNHKRQKMRRETKAKNKVTKQKTATNILDIHATKAIITLKVSDLNT